MRFLRKSLMGLFLLAATVSLFVFAFGMVRGAIDGRGDDQRRGGGPRERVFAVNVVDFMPSTQTPVLSVFGEVQSRRTLEIRPLVGGKVMELHPDFQDGGQIAEGEVILRIDASDAETALDLVQADRADAQAELREATRALTLAQDEIIAAQAQADLRVKALQRQRDLVARGVGTEAAVETAEFAASSATQAILSRRQALQSAEARLDQANARLRRLDISEAEAERRLRETTLFAGFDGTFADVSVVEGGKVTISERIGQLVDPEDLEVAFRVSTSQHRRLLDENGKLRRAGVTAKLDILGAELETKGTLTREAALVGEGLTGRLLFARLNDPKGLRPGDFVEVEIVEPSIERVARLPATALSAANTILIVGDEDRLQERDVTLVRRQGDEVLVRGRGLRDARVVSERTPLLGVGIKVRALGANDDVDVPIEPEMITLAPERRAKLVAFVEGNNRMPAAAKDRILAQLQEAEVRKEMVDRIEGRMGG